MSKRKKQIINQEERENIINKLPYVKESLVFARNEDKTDTLLCAKIVYDKKEIEKADNQEDKNKKNIEKEYEKIIWNDIKEINQNLPVFKHIKKITITTDELEKTTTQKIKRNAELKKLENNKQH